MLTMPGFKCKGPIMLNLGKFERLASKMRVFSAIRAWPVMAALALSMVLVSQAWASSLQYMGNATNDIDRVKIRIDNPADNNPGPPADIGAEDFTIEFWVKPQASNTEGSIGCGANYNWIFGNIIFDRDRFNQTRAFGVSLGAGRVVFGVKNSADQNRTICGSTDLRDGSWHHVAVQRRRSDGFLSLYVDGSLEASADGPDGDISYPDDGVPGNFCNGSCDFSDPFIVIGAEKHDVAAPYYGPLDELRLSNSIRYSSSFTPSQQAFVADGSTVGLYHFDEGSGDQINDSSTGGMSPGIRRFGGNPAGPVWIADTPISGGGGGNSGTLQFSASSYSVGEADGARTISVTRNGGSNGAVTADYSTADGTANSGSDYTAATNTLAWSDSDTAAKTFDVGIVDDGDSENDETINLSLSNVTGGAVIGARNSAVLTINDNDAPIPGTLAFSSANYSVSEGAGSAQITVTRTSGSDGAVAVTYATADGSAVSGSDYQSASGTLNWADGDGATKSFNITVLDDSAVESAETVALSLSNATAGAGIGPINSAILTIADDDTAVAGTLAFASASYSVSEGSSSVSIGVVRSGGSDGAVSIDYATANGTATAGSDYQSASGTLDWADGNSGTRSFTVTILDDTADESNETVTVRISNATGSATVGTPASVTLTISDNDTAAPPPPPPPQRSGGGGAFDAVFLSFLLLTASLFAGQRARNSSRIWRNRKAAASMRRAAPISRIRDGA